MSEIKTEIKPNADGTYTITDAHSTADIVRWLLTQDDKETILYLIDGAQPQRKPIQNLQCFHCQDTIETLNDKVMQLMAKRTWVGLTDEDIDEWTPEIHFVIKAIEAKLKDKNGYAEENT